MIRSPRSRSVLARVAVAATLLLCASGARGDAATHSFLWRVSGHQTVVYIVGSVHMLSKDYYPLNPAIESAFTDSDLLIEEADLGEMLSPDSQLRILTRGMLPSGQSLEKVISPATYEQVRRHVAALGLPLEPLALFKPWALALTVLALEWQRAGFDPELGLDKHFYDRARSEGKAVQGLETTEYQISRFDGMTMQQQDRLLADSLKGLETERANVARLADAWKIGDVSTVERIALQDLKDDPLMYERLLLERNRNWLPKIEALFARRGHAFVVVGAAHLVGPDGILSMLRSRGFAVEQM
jgi:uncharacterized protein